MAFDIMQLFAPGALNRLLSPAAMAQPQNFLANPQAAQPAPALPAPVNIGNAPTVAGVDPWQGMREEDVRAVDPMVTASPARVAATPRAGSPINKEALNDLFLGWASGATPSESIANGAKLVAANRGNRQAANQTVEWLKSKGMDEQQARMLASSPPALSEYLKTLVAGNDPMKALQLEKAQLEVDNLRNPAAKLTDDQREYQAAKDQGFQGSFMDYQIKMKEAGRQQVNIDTGAKLPSGFRWIDPKNQELGVEPIPGGPATQIPGELAARIGLSGDFLEQAPALRERIAAGDVTGVYDVNRAQSGIGPQGEIYRQLQSGTDALMRLLTGAGMNETEARSYAERYLPTWRDSAESAASKLDNLVRELKATRDTAMRGRGGSPQQNSSGVVDYQEYFKGP